jgi:hypothetical protein
VHVALSEHLAPAGAFVALACGVAAGVELPLQKPLVAVRDKTRQDKTGQDKTPLVTARNETKRPIVFKLLYYVCLSRACLGKHSRSFCLRNCENTRAGVLSAPARQQLGSRPQRHPGLVPVPAKTRVFCECFPSLHLSRACLDKCLVFSMAHKRRAFFAPFCAKTTILPRQARDKHRESTQKKDRLSKDVISYILYIIYIHYILSHRISEWCLPVQLL